MFRGVLHTPHTAAAWHSGYRLSSAVAAQGTLCRWMSGSLRNSSQDCDSVKLVSSELPGHHIVTCLQGVDTLKLLQVLVLSCNELQRMEGLSGLTNLQHLDLAFNAIKRIEGIRVSPCCPQTVI